MQSNSDKSSMTTGVWLLVLVVTAVVIFTFACGGAYTGVQQARLSAAGASLGYIESVFHQAELVVASQGYAAPEGSYGDLLKSYDQMQVAALPEYEKAVLGAMLDIFGPARDFDFAIERYEDGTGLHTTIYYFPVKGRTNINLDPHYVLAGGQVTR